ncbi:MAG: hypothetical protein GX639_14320 [Fibrobacter sp.]|nr:hypothetical protein [Fibrobacter sp.]
MPKYSEDESTEVTPVSDSIPDNSNTQQVINNSNNTTSKVDMVPENQFPINTLEKEVNNCPGNVLPEGDGTKFQIRYSILRDQQPAIIVFHCSGKLVESNCLVLHNTFKMCSAKNLPFIIFDLTEVTAVEKEVWGYFSSKVSKLQKLNGILLFAGIRSEVLSETTDFNKLNICHCDTVATCCQAIRNLMHDHEKTDKCTILDEDDSSLEIQSNIHDFLFNERPKSEIPEMKLVDSLLGRKKKEVGSGKWEVESVEKDCSPAQSQPQSQPAPEFSPFEKTLLINSDGSNPIADARRMVMDEIRWEAGSEKYEVESVEKDCSPAQSQSQSQPDPEFSPFEKTILVNNDGSNPIADAKRLVLDEIRGEAGSEKCEVESVEKDCSPAQSQPQSQPAPEFSPFEKTILISSDSPNPIADARRMVLDEIRGEARSGKWEVESVETDCSHAQPQSQSQPAPEFSPFEKTILISSDGSNPIADAKRMVLDEIRGEARSGKWEVESVEKDCSPAQPQSQSQPDPEFSPIEKINFNSPGLFEKTVLLDDECGSDILDVKKKVLEELGKGHKEEVGSERREVKSRKTSLVSSQGEPLEKTVLINEIGVNPIDVTNDNDRKDEVGSGKWGVGSKESDESSVHEQTQSQFQPKPKSKLVVSDKSQTLSLKDLYIDDSMSTDYSVTDNYTEPHSGETDDILPLVDESQGMDFSSNDRTVMSQSATVDISRSSLGLTKTNEYRSLKNISANDPFSIQYGVYDQKVEGKNHTLPAGKTESDKLTAEELIFKVIAEYGPLNILQLKNHINEKLNKKDRISILKLLSLLRQVDLDTHEKRVRYYRSC